VAPVSSAPTTAGAPEWYAGLAVSPASFSRQLGEMQTSLQRANSVAQLGGAEAEQMTVTAHRTA